VSERESRAGFIAVVGRPNAGKSSFLNWIVGEKLTMVSHKANATRKRSNVIALYKDEKVDAQLIFIDTPGLHEKERLLNKFMLDEALKAIGDADLILFLAPIHDDIREYEKFLELNRKEIPHILLLTKIDEVKKEKIFQKIDEYSKYQDKFLELIPLSIKRGSQKDEILGILSRHIPSSPHYYDSEILTTSVIKDIYKEFIRESIFENTSKEIPYFSDVVIEKVEELDNLERVYAQIVVEKKSQKGIVIGEDGKTLRRIGRDARRLIEKLIDKKVYLKLFVVVKPNWSKDKKILGELGYDI
jgi:GTP-binding protein Era